MLEYTIYLSQNKQAMTDQYLLYLYYYLKNTLILVFVGLLISSISFQYTYAQEACFTVVPNTACNQTEVNVIDCTVGAVNVSYKYSEEEGFVNRTENVYSSPGTYTITQLAQFNINGSTQAKLTTRQVVILPTPLPNFRAYLCDNRVVSLEIRDNQYPIYFINWGDGSPIQTVTSTANLITHNYLLGGSYVITVTGNYVPANCGGANSVIVSPINAINSPRVRRIALRRLSPEAGEVELQFEADSNYTYQVFREGDTSPLVSLENTHGLTTRIIGGLNTTEQNLCFYIRTADACGNSLLTPPIYCTLTLNVTSQSNQNQIDWTNYPLSTGLPAGAFSQYILYRNEQPYQVFNDLSTNNFTDTEVDCNIEYCYRIEIRFNTANLDFRSISNTACVIAFSDLIPLPLLNFNATVEGSRSIRLFWDAPTDERVKEYRVRRSGGGDFQRITGEAQALDTDLALDQRYCYDIFYINDCNIQSSITAFACPVFLRGSSQEAGTINLNWTNYQNSNDSFEYYVLQKLDDELQVYQEIIFPVTAGRQFQDTEAKTDRQVMRYRIKTVIDEANQVLSYSNIIEVIQPFRIFFPNAFTPNDDGKNDTFEPKGLFIKQFEMRIYGRNGELLFTSQDLTQGWDGSYKGKPMPSGVYVYLVELTDFVGQTFTKRGTFNLIK